MSETCFVSESESAVLRERNRLAGLNRACRRNGLGDRYDEFVRGNLSEADVDDLALGRKAASARISNAVSPRVEVTVDSRDKFVKDMNDSLALRAGLMSDRSRASEISHPGSLPELARRCLARAGVSDVGLSSGEIVTRAISHSSSDFPNLLSNVANKALAQAYQAAPQTWRAFASVVTTKDFKSRLVTGLGQSPDLLATAEGEPMPEMTIPEKSDSYALATYTRRFGLTRQAIVNDDLAALQRVPAEMGAAAARLVSKLFYDLLISASGVGPTMAEDSKALFATDHPSGANYIAGATAIDIAGLSAARALMRKQTGLVGAGETAPVLNLLPSYLLVPAALEGVALQYTTQTTPAQGSNVSPAWMPRTEVVVEPRLDAGTNGTTAWLMVTKPEILRTVEVLFLEGNESPSLIRTEGSNVLGVEFGVVYDAAVRFLDHRGWFRSRGA